MAVYVEKPLVSVIMPVYNGAEYIAQAVESVLTQEVPVELLIIDDCSTDDVQKVLETWKNDGRVRYIRNRENIGAARSRNRGVQQAGGKYVAFLDADDWWDRRKLKEQIELMEKSGCVMCSTGRELVAADGNSTGKYIPVKEKITYRELLKHNSINCSSVMLPREVAASYPMEHDDSHEDYITWLRILREGGFCAGINKPYLMYRLSEGGKSRNKIKSALMTYRVYRYTGYGKMKSMMFFVSYAVHGVWKYR